jgi:hypothetical protein
MEGEKPLLGGHHKWYLTNRGSMGQFPKTCLNAVLKKSSDWF